MFYSGKVTLKYRPYPRLLLYYKYKQQITSFHEIFITYNACYNIFRHSIGWCASCYSF